MKAKNYIPLVALSMFFGTTPSFAFYAVGGPSTDYPIIDLTVPQPSDQDQDGILDSVDNCVLTANATQLDTDGDGFGNACDADLDNSCLVECADVAVYENLFLQTGESIADFNGDGIVNHLDTAVFRSKFFNPPGPSGSSTICD